MRDPVGLHTGQSGSAEPLSSERESLMLAYTVVDDRQDDKGSSWDGCPTLSDPTAPAYMQIEGHHGDSGFPT
jgi:hypothetical protein